MIGIEPYVRKWKELIYITNPETINDLRPSYGVFLKRTKSKCRIEKYIDDVMKTSIDSELISHRDKGKGKSQILVG